MSKHLIRAMRRGIGPKRRRRGRRGAAWSVMGLAFAGLLALALPMVTQTATAGPVPLTQVGCAIAQVTDGDTLRMVCGGAEERVRLTGFDTPELFSPGCAAELQKAEAAKRALGAALAQARTVAMIREGQDRFGRSLVALHLDGVPLAATMIDTGHARPYRGGPRQGWCGP